MREEGVGFSKGKKCERGEKENRIFHFRLKCQKIFIPEYISFFYEPRRVSCILHGRFFYQTNNEEHDKNTQRGVGCGERRFFNPIHPVSKKYKNIFRGLKVFMSFFYIYVYLSPRFCTYFFMFIC